MNNFDSTYKLLFRKYYANLLFYATRIVGEEEAEDVVQDVFVELWQTKRYSDGGRADTGISVSGGVYPCFECFEAPGHQE